MWLSGGGDDAGRVGRACEAHEAQAEVLVGPFEEVEAHGGAAGQVGVVAHGSEARRAGRAVVAHVAALRGGGAVVLVVDGCVSSPFLLLSLLRFTVECFEANISTICIMHFVGGKYQN